MTSNPHLEHQVFKIRQLIDDYTSGRIVIPEFQREYVWKRGKAPRLIDSLYKGFPISSFLLWESEESTITARRRDPQATETRCHELDHRRATTHHYALQVQER